jgi:hypothetical protein
VSTAELNEYEAVLSKVRSWAPEMRLSLAEQLLHSLHPVVRPAEPRGVPVEQVRGIAAKAGPPPDDETVRRWVEEHRAEKHGA